MEPDTKEVDELKARLAEASMDREVLKDRLDVIAQKFIDSTNDYIAIKAENTRLIRLLSQKESQNDDSKRPTSGE